GPSSGNADESSTWKVVSPAEIEEDSVVLALFAAFSLGAMQVHLSFRSMVVGLTGIQVVSGGGTRLDRGSNTSLRGCHILDTVANRRRRVCPSTASSAERRRRVCPCADTSANTRLRVCHSLDTVAERRRRVCPCA